MVCPYSYHWPVATCDLSDSSAWTPQGARTVTVMPMLQPETQDSPVNMLRPGSHVYPQALPLTSKWALVVCVLCLYTGG